MATDTDIVARFDIHLDAGEEPVFKEGYPITGKLLIDIRKPTIINAVKLILEGTATWLNDPFEKNDNEKVFLEDEFVFYKRPQSDSESGHNQWIGDFSLPFQVELPEGCPSTYEGLDASIRYVIRASLVQEDKIKENHEYHVKKSFTFVLPSEEYIVSGNPAKTQDSVTLGTCCFRKLTAELSLNKTIYFPGEDVFANLKIEKRLPVDALNHMEARLVDRVCRIDVPEVFVASPWRTLLVSKLETQYKTPSRVKKGLEKSGLFLLTVPPVCPSTQGDHEDATNIDHTVPPMNRYLLSESPSTVTLCFREIPFLKIEYGIQVTIGHDILLEVPIEIGEKSTRKEKNKLEDLITSIEETALETDIIDEGIKIERKETTHSDASDSEKTSVETAKTRVAESAEIPEIIKDETEIIKEFFQLFELATEESIPAATQQTIETDKNRRKTIFSEITSDGNTIKSTSVREHATKTATSTHD